MCTADCRLTGQPHGNSFLAGSVVLQAHTMAVRTGAGAVPPAAASGVVIRDNVLVESWDDSTVVIAGHHAVVEANLALGTTKDMAGGFLG